MQSGAGDKKERGLGRGGAARYGGLEFTGAELVLQNVTHFLFRIILSMWGPGGLLDLFLYVVLFVVIFWFPGGFSSGPMNLKHFAKKCRPTFFASSKPFWFAFQGLEASHM